MNLVLDNNERFIVDRRGEPAVVIMSVQDFIRGLHPNGCAAARLADESVAGAKRRELDALTPDEINAEITAHRHEEESTGARPSDPGRYRYQPAGLRVMGRPSSSANTLSSAETYSTQGSRSATLIERGKIEKEVQ
jgi:hypothetical protein